MSEPNCDEQDAEDMRRLVAGKEVALNALMERHAQKLFHYLIRCLQDESDAADLAQETFARVYQHRARFDPRQKFSTWMYTIASNLVRDRYRWRTRHPQISLEAETGENAGNLKEHLPTSEAAPDQELEADERAATVRAAIAELPEELREPLLLALYEGLPQAEIAAILKCSVKAVETRIYRARNQLRPRLAELQQSH